MARAPTARAPAPWTTPRRAPRRCASPTLRWWTRPRRRRRGQRRRRRRRRRGRGRAHGRVRQPAGAEHVGRAGDLGVAWAAVGDTAALGLLLGRPHAYMAKALAIPVATTAVGLGEDEGHALSARDAVVDARPLAKGLAAGRLRRWRRCGHRGRGRRGALAARPAALAEHVRRAPNRHVAGAAVLHPAPLRPLLRGRDADVAEAPTVPVAPAAVPGGQHEGCAISARDPVVDAGPLAEVGAAPASGAVLGRANAC
mmetsp:Transcript_140575/g.437180  ORF Transcript_140575/g.437180 Transcript_140575/m.437180 type:complete len:255 (-) Transcript_140575:302-1066(-)